MNLTEKKKAVQKIVATCPQAQTSNLKCPLRNVRKLTPVNQMHYLNGLTLEQLDHILLYHKNCIEIAATMMTRAATPPLKDYPGVIRTH